VGALAERALAIAGADAVLLLGRRQMPMLGISCSGCGGFTAPPLRLLPAATASAACGCTSPFVPFATRSRIGARELAASDAAPLTLRVWGSSPGEELLAVGCAGSVRLRTQFDWEDMR
jgi:hypothetical protein